MAGSVPGFPLLTNLTGAETVWLTYNGRDYRTTVSEISATAEGGGGGGETTGLTVIEDGETGDIIPDYDRSLLVLTHATATWALPAQADQDFPEGFWVRVIGADGEDVTIIAASGVTVNGVDSAVITTADALFVRAASNEWTMSEGGGPSSGIPTTEVTSEIVTAAIEEAADAGGATASDMANALTAVIPSSAPSGIAAILTAIGALDMSTRESLVSSLALGLTGDDGPVNPGEFWTTDENGLLTGEGPGGNDLAEPLNRTAGTFPFDPELLGAYLAKGDDIASAATIEVGEGAWFHVTGTTTITDIDFEFDGDDGGRSVILIFDDVLQVTHSSSLKVRGGSNWSTAAGDAAIVMSDGSDVVYVYPIGSASGGGGTAATTTEALTGTNTTKYVTPDALAALWEQGSNIASASTISVGEGGFFHVTGTTTIDDIDWGTDKTGRRVKLCFDDALQITHSSTLILPGATNITTVAGDVYEFTSEGSDVARCTGRLLTTVSGGALVGDGSETPYFAGIQVGHASDTTLTRSSGGVLAVEGVTVSLNSTSATHTAGTIELGAASDTTLSRSSAGVLAVEGVTVSLNSTSATHTAGTIELGAASDTTISRGAAGLIEVEGVRVVTVSATQTLTNKTLTSPTLTTPVLGTPSSGTLSACDAATTGAKGVVELATSAEINTGTDTARVLGVDEFAGSNFGIKEIGGQVFAPTTSCSTGDGIIYFAIPPSMNGMNLVYAGATVVTAGVTGTMDIQIARTRSGSTVAVLSTKITIDSGELSGGTANFQGTAANAAVINTSNDDAATHDLWRVDVDAVQTTAAKGLLVTLGFQLP